MPAKVTCEWCTVRRHGLLLQGECNTLLFRWEILCQRRLGLLWLVGRLRLHESKGDSGAFAG